MSSYKSSSLQDLTRESNFITEKTRQPEIRLSLDSKLLVLREQGLAGIVRNNENKEVKELIACYTGPGLQC